MIIVERFPEIENGNYVVDIHNTCELCFKAIVPHQMVCHWKNFWGAELTTMEYGSRKPNSHIGNQPIKEKIFEHINDTFQTIDEINSNLRANGYNTSFDTDIKSFICKLENEGRVIIQYENKVMTVKRVHS